MNTAMLIDLNYGQKFRIPGLDNSYRNLSLKRNNDCSAQISGQRCMEISGSKKWLDIPSGFTISPYTVVELIN